MSGHRPFSEIRRGRKKMKEYEGNIEDFWETGMEDTSAFVFVSNDEKFWYPSNYVRCSICGSMATKDGTEQGPIKVTASWPISDLDPETWEPPKVEEHEHNWLPEPQFPDDPEHNGMYRNLDSLYTLQNGDYLIVYAKDRTSVVWEGKIDLRKGYGEKFHTYADWQNGVDEQDWFAWFVYELPAKLRTDKWF